MCWEDGKRLSGKMGKEKRVRAITLSDANVKSEGVAPPGCRAEMFEKRKGHGAFVQ